MTLIRTDLVLLGFGVNITVTYDPPLDVSLGPNEYRAASGPVVAVCNVFGGAESTVYSYQWSSTCRQCPFLSARTNHVVDAVIYSSDAGVNTCTVTDESGNNGTASFEIDVVGERIYYNVMHVYMYAQGK